VIVERVRETARRVKALAHYALAPVVTRVVGGRSATPFVVFPQTVTGPGTGDSVPFDSTAPPCRQSDVDNSTWNVVTIQFTSSRIQSLTLCAPSEFIRREFPHVTDGEGEYWGRILAQLHTPRDLKDATRDESSVAFWIGPQEGFPTTGMPPGTSQLVFTECQDAIQGRRVHFAAFTLQTPRGETSYNVAALWRIKPGVVVTALGSTRDPVVQQRILGILRSVRLD
jgi:hypothetical protein